MHILHIAKATSKTIVQISYKWIQYNHEEIMEQWADKIISVYDAGEKKRETNNLVSVASPPRKKSKLLPQATRRHHTTQTNQTSNAKMQNANRLTLTSDNDNRSVLTDADKLI